MIKKKLAVLWQKLVSWCNRELHLSYRGVVWCAILIALAVIDLGLGLLIYFGC